MRMIDYDKKASVKTLGIYLTVDEAEWMLEELKKLLESPENNNHFHITPSNSTREISCSIITERKLKNIENYNKLEQQVLLEK